jgi:hypothetical protein
MTKLEEVARALCRRYMARTDEHGPNWDSFGASLDDAVNREWRDSSDDARCAVEALREPSQMMFLIMERAGVSFQTQQRMWPKLIDAILSEPQV